MNLAQEHADKFLREATAALGSVTKKIKVVYLPDSDFRFVKYSEGRYAVTTDDFKIFSWDEQMSGRSGELGDEW